MRRSFIPVLAAVAVAAGAGGPAVGQVLAHDLRPELQCINVGEPDAMYQFTLDGKSWPGMPQTALWTHDVNGVRIVHGSVQFTNEIDGVVKHDAVPGTNTVRYGYLAIGTDGFTREGSIERELNCDNSSPPTPPVEPPEPPPEPPVEPPAPPPSSTPQPQPSSPSTPVTTPTPSMPTSGGQPAPVVPVGPDLPPTCADLRRVGAGKNWLRTFGCLPERTTVRTTARVCRGPWTSRVRPRTPVRVRAVNGVWYGYRDRYVLKPNGKLATRRVRFEDGSVLRRAVIKSRGSFCGPVNPPVTG